MRWICMEVKVTKDVKITVKGVHRDAETEISRMEISVPGEYFFKNGSHYIFYEETEEGSGTSVKNSLKLKGNLLELNRKGAVNSRMVFETGKSHVVDYATPFGMLRMETATSRILYTEEENHLQIRAEYELWMDGAKVSSCRLTVKIEPLIKDIA
ncbi:MAG: DUF1934 domain-containing protein [Lachnospiraceae bacterium]|nr:DUF1934 domain-containing protein [Lachnospiraceae bacterium]